MIDAMELVCMYVMFVVAISNLMHLYTQDGRKPIHFASMQGNVSTFKILINLGVDPRSPRQKDVRNSLTICSEHLSM